MVAITVIVIVKWHWRLDAFNGLTTLILALGVMLGVCSCVTRTRQISSSTRLVPEDLRIFRYQLYGERDFTAAFFPHQDEPLAQRLIVVMTLVTNVAFSLWRFGHSQDWWQSMLT
jgi:hypothetical protein